MSDLASLPEVLTIAEVAEFLRVDPKTVRDTLVNTHLLKAHKVGNQWRVLRAELGEYLAAQLELGKPSLRSRLRRMLGGLK